MLRATLRMLLAMARGPGTAGNARDRMERLFRDQAAVYDRFRERFLHGRRELVGHLAPAPGEVLVELGAGTGWNLGSIPEPGRLRRLYLVDLSPSMLAQARARVERMRLANAVVVEGDATLWRPADREPADAVLFSYSLSMIPDWFRALDNAAALLKPGGRIGVVDFHLARARPEPGRARQGALYRAFWRAWLARDGVIASPDHPAYLEYRFERLLLSEHRKGVVGLPLLRPPYFLFLGRKGG